MSEILIEKRDGGAFVTFNRPEARNALNTDMVDAISALLASIEEDADIRYLVFRGSGGHFSAGGDMEAFGRSLELNHDERRASFEGRIRHNGKCFLRLESLSVPVISIVQGAAAGAGLSFVLASDFVLAAEDAVLIFAQPRVGLPLDLSLTYHLPRVVGPKIARQLAMTGAMLNANDALRTGIVDEIHAHDKLDDALASLLKKLSTVAPRAAGRSKWLINGSDRRGLEEQIEQEALAIGNCVVEPDFSEGVQAFLQKRRAVFTGKSE